MYVYIYIYIYTYKPICIYIYICNSETQVEERLEADAAGEKEGEKTLKGGLETYPTMFCRRCDTCPRPEPCTPNPEP